MSLYRENNCQVHLLTHQLLQMSTIVNETTYFNSNIVLLGMKKESTGGGGRGAEQPHLNIFIVSNERLQGARIMVLFGRDFGDCVTI